VSGFDVNAERRSIIGDLRRLREVLVESLAEVLAAGEDRQLAEELAQQIARTIALEASVTPAVQPRT
jgi:hypothetical protein